MAQPRKSGSRSGAPTDAAAEQETRSALAALRDLLQRSLMLPADRVRETLDDAVSRGRITRDDAEDLVEQLVALGRRQTDDALTRIERVAGVGGQARGAVRRPPGTDRVLREVDRVRRTAGLGSSFPISGYDELTASQITARLPELDERDLRKVRDHEKRNANRKSVLAAVEKRLH